MRHVRRGLHRTVRLAAVGGLLCGGLMMTSAMADEPPGAPAAGGGTAAPPGRSHPSGRSHMSGRSDPSGQSEPSGKSEPPGQSEPSGRSAADAPTVLGARLVERLGPSRTAGTWIGADGRPVVAVTDAAAAAEVDRAGGRAKVVDHSLRRLRSATEALAAAPRVPGTAWSVDYASNRVVVQADSTVSAADWSRLSDLAERIGGFVRMRRTEGSFSTRLNGADPIFARNGRCSAGFNVTDGKRAFVLTAGHCGPRGTTWFQDAGGTTPLGATVAGSFPGGDFSLVEYADAGGRAPNGDASGAVNVVGVGGGKGVRITAAADPVVGQQVFRSGSTTGVRSGRVTAVNATVNYREGTVTGLIETTVCAEPGDSGGPLFADGLALGVTSGGNGDCTTGGITYFQPATTAMASLGVTLTGATTATGDGTGAASQPGAAGSAGTAGAVAAPGPANRPPAPTGFIGMRTLTPGLLVFGVSLLVLTALGWVRSVQERRRYRREYSPNWS